MSLDAGIAGFDDAVFISYTHVDNRPYGPEELHWVAHLHEQLTNRMRQVFGHKASVFLDKKLLGNDVFAETLVDRLEKTATLVSVCSPPYLESEWCRRELDAFVAAAEAGEGVRVGGVRPHPGGLRGVRLFAVRDP